MQSDIGISRQVMEFKPIIPEKAKVYIRNEKEGWKSVTFNSHENHAPILLTKSDAEFIDLCDGEHTVLEIIDIVSKQNKDIPWIINVINSNRLISLLIELRVVHGENLNSILGGNILKLGDGYEIGELSYMEHNQYSQFINSSFSDINRHFFYMNPITNEQVFNEKYFRRKLDQIDNRVFVVSKNSSIIMALMLTNGKFQNEFILENLVCINNEIPIIRLKHLNILLSCKNLCIKINSIGFDDILSGFFTADYEERFMLKNELQNQISIIETNLYYLSDSKNFKKDVG